MPPFPLPVLLISLLFSILLRPISSYVDVLVSASAGVYPRVLLVTAHPDDECMFFAPTIQAIQRHDPSVELFSLCLSMGDADGLGAIRKKELEDSLDVLGFHQDRRWVLDHPQLKDNISVFWEAEVIANVVRPYVLQHSITSILTFDHQGISSHPNHISLPQGISHLISHFPASASPPPRLFTLITVPLAQKYISVVSPLLAKLDIHFASFLSSLGSFSWSPGGPFDAERANSAPSGGSFKFQSIPVAVSGMSEYRTALRAMQKHESQLVWFRWLYVSFSRYMWVNEWTEVVPGTRTSVPNPPP